MLNVGSWSNNLGACFPSSSTYWDSSGILCVFFTNIVQILLYKYLLTKIYRLESTRVTIISRELNGSHVNSRKMEIFQTSTRQNLVKRVVFQYPNIFTFTKILPSGMYLLLNGLWDGMRLKAFPLLFYCKFTASAPVDPYKERHFLGFWRLIHWRSGLLIMNTFFIVFLLDFQICTIIFS